MSEIPLRPNVCLIILNKERQIFLAERFGCPGIWQLPQGGIEQGMTPAEAAIKEAHEELGVPKKNFKILQHLLAQHEYEFSDPIPAHYLGKWRGQVQTFFVLEYLGTDAEITLNRYDQELMNWRWCSVAEVRKLAEPRRLVGYEKAFSELGI